MSVMKYIWKNIRMVSGILVLRSPVLKRSLVRTGSLFILGLKFCPGLVAGVF